VFLTENLTKSALIVKFNGAGLGAGYSQSLKLRLQKVTIQSQEISTGLGDYFAIQSNFEAELRTDRAPSYYDMIARNETNALFA
jgi:hypothetical protein